MRKIAQVDMLGDEAILERLGKWQLRVLLATLIGGLLMVLLGGAKPDTWQWWVLLLLVSIELLPIHELIHALAFKVLAPKGTKVLFGSESGMLYCGCPGVRFKVRDYLIVAIAPIAFVAALSLAVYVLCDAPLWSWCLLGMHASGCVGDYYYIQMIMDDPRVTMCEDTDTGLILWGDDPADESNPPLNEADLPPRGDDR